MTDASRALAPTCVLLHGWGLGRDVWHPLQTEWAASSSWPCHTISWSGYDGTINDHSTWESTAHAIAAQLMSLPHPVVLCAWSLGAQMALHLAHPDHPASARISQLVLISATPCFAQRHDWTCAQPTDVFQQFQTLISSQGAAGLKRFNALVQQGDQHARELTRWVGQHVLSDASTQPSDHTLLQGLHWLATLDMRDQLARIDKPCLLIHGLQDSLVPAEAGAWLSQQLPCSQAVWMANAGHAPMLHDPRHLVGLIQAFVSGQHAHES